jgi:N-acetylglutamate synthase/N-acetylornithine aminotransferase
MKSDLATVLAFFELTEEVPTRPDLYLRLIKYTGGGFYEVEVDLYNSTEKALVFLANLTNSTLVVGDEEIYGIVSFMEYSTTISWNIECFKTQYAELVTKYKVSIVN